MINNINNFGTINFYENNTPQSKQERADLKDITPLQENDAWSEKEQVSTTKNSPNNAAKYKDILPIPRKGKYTEVRRYIEERCKFDEEFKSFVERHSRVELCMRLSNEFGWDVDDHHLGVNMNRNR